MLRIRNLHRPGVEPFSLDLDGGECVSLTGPSGAGKSLLLRAVADLDPNRGSVSLDRVDRGEFSAPEWRRAVGYLASESGWWADDVGAHFPDPEPAGALIGALGMAPDAVHWPVARLSTGERQRLAFARMALTEPRAMLLDEPSSGLDPDATALMEEILLARLAAGTAILLVTHDAGQAGRLAGRRLRMTAGAVVEDTPGEPAR